MTATVSIPLGVVVERKELKAVWADHVWRPVSVVVGEAGFDGWREMLRGEGWVHYFAGTLPLELHRRETVGYRHNLESGSPSIYVVLRKSEDGDPPVRALMVSASPYEAAAYTESGDELVEPVPMPDALAEAVARFVEDNHVDEPFRKRQRDKVRIEEHKFGQEPLAVIRKRMGETRDG